MLTSETDMAFADGGIKQEGNTVDPVSGNEVPPGAMKEEVRDDVDAKLSVGEFVFPADVVRYVGLSTLMKLRDKAKVGLKRMEEIGQMGNAEEVKDGEALHSDGGDDEAFGSEIDSILSEEGGDEEKFAAGGYVNPSSEAKYKNAPIKGFEMVAMTNAEGRVIYIPHVNGKPQLPVPAGYKVKAEGVAAATEATTPAAGTGAQGGTATEGAATDGTVAGGVPSSNDSGLAQGTSLSAGQVQGGMALAGLAGVPGAGIAGMSSTISGFIADSINSISNSFATSANQSTIAGQMGLTSAEAGTTVGQAAVASGIDSASQAIAGTTAATTGASGTGGAAASAAAAAAAAAVAAGMSDSAVGEAAQAAANAALAGASPAAAANAGAAAAAAASGGDVGVPSGGGLGFSTGPVGEQGAIATGISPGEGVAPSDGGTAPSGDAAPSGEGTASGGDGYAKGGFVSKKKSTKSTGLASRRK